MCSVISRQKTTINQYVVIQKLGLLSILSILSMLGGRGGGGLIGELVFSKNIKSNSDITRGGDFLVKWGL